MMNNHGNHFAKILHIQTFDFIPLCSPICLHPESIIFNDMYHKWDIFIYFTYVKNILILQFYLDFTDLFSFKFCIDSIFKPFSLFLFTYFHLFNWYAQNEKQNKTLVGFFFTFTSLCWLLQFPFLYRSKENNSNICLF